MKICGITTRPGTAKVMFKNLEYAHLNGYKCTVICQPCKEFKQGFTWGEFIPIEMNRGNVSPLEALKATYRLYKIFRKNKYDIIQYASSNAGLYASLAGYFAHIPNRIFLQWGIPYVEYKGFKRAFYKLIEFLTCKFSTSIQPDSNSNLQFALQEGLYNQKKGVVLGRGSAQGVDLCKFNINYKTKWREEIRKEYNISPQTKIFCFVGRIVPQKGVNELLQVFLKLKDSDFILLIVGPPDEIELLDRRVLEETNNSPKIIMVGSVQDPERFHAAADFFVLPSYREGFPNTILEAGALGVPSIVTNINGMIDLVEDDINGFICEPKSVESLQQAVQKALSLGEENYNKMSNAIFTKVKTYFDSNYIKQEFLSNRNNLLNQHLKKQ